MHSTPTGLEDPLLAVHIHPHIGPDPSQIPGPGPAQTQCPHPDAHHTRGEEDGVKKGRYEMIHMRRDTRQVIIK
ncbi:hypothetical protein CGMCC3_g2735 [Colletotrichum fructicola]|nr:uncharacterized protein CGMCC3_g2735 [Colletotrichum fructicola]KAE9581183.1 hypothetical protein CGMCC3_g2735 [Colletotrichum fructicola]